MTATQAASARGWRIRNAEQELRRFEDDVAALHRSVQRTMTYALACTGCDSEQQTVDNYLTDMFADVFAKERKKLRAELEEAGGDVTKFAAVPA